MMWDLYSSEPGFKGDSNPTTGINLAEIENRTISVFPKPASNSVQIETGNIDITTVEIYNLHGQKVFQQNTEHQHTINISSFRNGIYLLKLTAINGEIFQTKFIKN